MKILKDEIGAIYILQDKKTYFLVELINVKPFEIKFYIKMFLSFINLQKKNSEQIEKFIKEKLEF
ncbi:hypothetical protein HZQ75_02725 [Elizabethkingia anophelis]|uniref:Uncharacterized protein n=1 Tax=Elizabethkingia anophelis R26 TaxID=1246994 RepID=A0ABM6MS50_9FLAO|nr:hypothetical protein [Elizabethkingia anophelis]ATC35932.1 hypothetical protein BAZ09_006760 [Elizabethkingia anophelis R26]ATC39570.1 hypothetical protein EAAG1_006760 [Elizabethkingia anophelis Ag1]ATC43249.1 hypothetical protein CMV41_06760 [Elizabethkingia anophelis]ATC46925.1 hypothetical protein CMV40_06760 [Elizabethkingia anophelis]ELR79538.1 hypothetical protein D505_08315 [Elizabethkingia anophelis R26]